MEGAGPGERRNRVVEVVGRFDVYEEVGEGGVAGDLEAEGVVDPLGFVGLCGIPGVVAPPEPGRVEMDDLTVAGSEVDGPGVEDGRVEGQDGGGGDQLGSGDGEAGGQEAQKGD